MLKKFITYILTVCMVCSLACSIPFTADAADPIQYSTIIVEQNPEQFKIWDMSSFENLVAVSENVPNTSPAQNRNKYTNTSGMMVEAYPGAEITFKNDKLVYENTTGTAAKIAFTTSNRQLFSTAASEIGKKYTLAIPLKFIKAESNSCPDNNWFSRMTFYSMVKDWFWNAGGVAHGTAAAAIETNGTCQKDDATWGDFNDLANSGTEETLYIEYTVAANKNVTSTAYFDSSFRTVTGNIDENNCSGYLTQLLININSTDGNYPYTMEIGDVKLYEGSKAEIVEWNIVGNNLVFSGAPGTTYDIKAKKLDSNVDVYTGQIETNEHGKAELSLGELSSVTVSNPGRYTIYLSDEKYENVENAKITLYVGAETMLDNVDRYIGSDASDDDKNIFKQCFMKNASIDDTKAQEIMNMYTGLSDENKAYVAEETSAQNGFAEFSKLVKLTSLWGGALPTIPVDSAANSIITVSEGGSVKASYWDVSSTNGKAAAISSTSNGTDRHKASITAGDYVHELHYNNSTSDAAPVISYEGDNIVYTMRSASTDEIRFTNTEYNLIDMTKDGEYTFKLPLSADAAMDVTCCWNDGPSYWTAGATAYSKLCGTVQLSGDNTVKNLYMQFTSIANNKVTVDVYWGDTKLGTYDSAYNSNPAGSAVAGMVSGISLKVSNATSGNKLKLGDIKFWSSTKANEPSDDDLTCGFDSEAGKLTIDGEAGEAYTVRVLNPEYTSGIDAFANVYAEARYKLVKDFTDICGKENLTSSDGHREFTLPVLNPGVYKIDVLASGFTAPKYTVLFYNKLNTIFTPSDIMSNITSDGFTTVYKNLGYSVSDGELIKTTASTLADNAALSAMTELDISKLYGAVLGRSMVEHKLSDDANIALVAAEFARLGIDTGCFELLKANNNRTEVMDSLFSANPDTFSELASELKKISVLKGVKNAAIDSEVQTFIAQIGNTKYDGADENGKLAIADAVKGGDYLTIEALSAAMDGVTLESGSAPGNDNNNNNNNNNYTGGKLNTGSSGGSTGGGGAYVPSNPVNPSGQSSYSDVPVNHWASQYIEAMTKQGIVSGYNGSFNPDNTVTRAEYLKMLCGIFKVDGADSTGFADVLLTDWYAPFVGGAEKAGLIEGTGTGFNPNGEITRQDAALMLTRFMKYAGIELDAAGDLSYSDAGEISDYAKEAIQILTGMGVLNGVGDGRIAPLELMTRAQAAKMLFFAID